MQVERDMAMQALLQQRIRRLRAFWQTCAGIVVLLLTGNWKTNSLSSQVIKIRARKGYEPGFRFVLATFSAAFSFAVWCGMPFVEAQNLTPGPTYPTAEYYLAYDLFQDGQTLPALQGFQSALKRSKQVGSDQFVDSIPPMVYAGECLFQQGNLAAAMEHYDAALSIAIHWPNWLSELRALANGNVAATGNTSDDSKLKGVSWFEKSRRTRRGSFARYWTFLGKLAIAPGSSPSLNPANGDPFQMDAIEVMRCQAIALRRRQQILGPLTIKSPLTQPLIQLYKTNIAAAAPVFQASQNICLGLATLASGDTVTSANLLQSNTSLTDGIDHPLTPLALLAASELTRESENFTSMQNSLCETSLAAAEFEQLDILAETVIELAACANGDSVNRTATIVKQIGAWTRTKSRLAHVQCICALAELSAASKNSSETELLFKQALALLSAREISMPKSQASLRDSLAQAMLAEGKLPEGQQTLYQAIAIISGDEVVGTSSKRLFQLRLTESLFRAGQLDAASAEDILASLLSEPASADWRFEPLETMVWLTADKRSAFDTLLEIKVRGGTLDEILTTVDHRLRNQFWQSLPLSGRVLSYGSLFHRDLSQQQKDLGPALTRLHARNPLVQSTAQELRRLADDWTSRPLQLDPLPREPDGAARWTKINEMGRAQTTRIWQLAASHDSLGRIYPPAAQPRQIQSLLGKDDGIVVFYTAAGERHGCLITSASIERWVIGNSDDVDSLIALTLKAIGVGQGKALTLDWWKSHPWRTALANLSLRLFPLEKQQRLRSVRRLFVVPDGKLWYLPFDMLPTGGNPGESLLIAEKQIVYVPTLGMIPRSFEKTPAAKSTLGIVKDQFFMSDSTAHRQMVQDISKANANSSIVVLGQSANRTPSSFWLRMQTHRAWIASSVQLTDPHAFSPFAYDSGTPESMLSNWLELPIGCPKQMAWMGIETITTGSKLGDGHEIFNLACSTMACGNQSLLVSRWPVRGASSQALLRGFLEELDSERASAAWQRSVFSLWSDQLDVKSEPILGQTASATSVIPGDTPLLWSSYALIGDTNPAAK